jgi:hypothetical protein
MDVRSANLFPKYGLKAFKGGSMSGNDNTRFFCKGTFIQISLEILILYSIVKFLDLKEDVVFPVILFYIGIHLALWLKKTVVDYVIYKFTKRHVVNIICDDLNKYDLPKPDEVDIREPELYFDSILESECYTFEQRLLASTYSFSFKKNRQLGQLQALFKEINISKEALTRFRMHT